MIEPWNNPKVLKKKDMISKKFWNKSFNDISLYEATFVNSEYNKPGSVAPSMKRRKR